MRRTVGVEATTFTRRAAVDPETRKAMNEQLVVAYTQITQRFRCPAHSRTDWAQHHVCTDLCGFFHYKDTKVCLLTGSFHYCTEMTCDRMVRTGGHSYCELTGNVYDELDFGVGQAAHDVDDHEDREDAEMDGYDERGAPAAELDAPMTPRSEPEAPGRTTPPPPPPPQQPEEVHMPICGLDEGEQEPAPASHAAMQRFVERTMLQVDTHCAVAAAAPPPVKPPRKALRQPNVCQRQTEFESIYERIFSHRASADSDLTRELTSNVERLWVHLHRSEHFLATNPKYSADLHLVIVLDLMKLGFRARDVEVVPFQQWVVDSMPRTSDIEARELQHNKRTTLRVRRITSMTKVFQDAFIDMIQRQYSKDKESLQQLRWQGASSGSSRVR